MSFYHLYCIIFLKIFFGKAIIEKHVSGHTATGDCEPFGLVFGWVKGFYIFFKNIFRGFYIFFGKVIIELRARYQMTQVGWGLIGRIAKLWVFNPRSIYILASKSATACSNLYIIQTNLKL